MITPANKEAIAEAFRDASGITHRRKEEARMQKLQQSSVVTKAWHVVFDTGGSLWEEHHVKERGLWQLQDLLADVSAIYPRRQILYAIDEENRKFIYDLLFSGERIGEQGAVEITFTPSALCLRRGQAAVVENVAEKGHILHLPEGEGITVVMKKYRDSSWNFDWNRINIATWYPDLTKTPQSFSRPQDGRFVW